MSRFIFAEVAAAEILQGGADMRKKSCQVVWYENEEIVSWFFNFGYENYQFFSFILVRHVVDSFRCSGAVGAAGGFCESAQIGLSEGVVALDER